MLKRVTRKAAGLAHSRSFSAATRKPPPPPPPRPPGKPPGKPPGQPSPSTPAQAAVKTSSSSSAPSRSKVQSSKSRTNWILPLGALAAVALYATREESGLEVKARDALKSMRKTVGGDDGSAGDTNLARDYLKNLAEKGDASAASVLQYSKESKEEEAEVSWKEGGEYEPDFRLDISKDGLLQTLTIMLNAKRKEEEMILNNIRRQARFGRAHYPEQELKDLRQDKKDIKDRIKALEKNR